jgi:hypothetical protein
LNTTNELLNFYGNFTQPAGRRKTDRNDFSKEHWLLQPVKRSSLARPVKELKAFRKVALAPGEETSVEFVVSVDDLKFFDDTRHEWVAEPGKFTVSIGASAADIRSTVDFELK